MSLSVSLNPKIFSLVGLSSHTLIALDRAKAQLVQSEFQLGKAKLHVDRDTPLAPPRAIPDS
jgi:hypothetical protein